MNVWRQRNGRQATYKALVEAFIKANHRDYAENACKLISTSQGRDTTVSDTPATASSMYTCMPITIYSLNSLLHVGMNLRFR